MTRQQRSTNVGTLIFAQNVRHPSKFLTLPMECKCRLSAIYVLSKKTQCIHNNTLFGVSHYLLEESSAGIFLRTKLATLSLFFLRTKLATLSLSMVYAVGRSICLFSQTNDLNYNAMWFQQNRTIS